MLVKIESVLHVLDKLREKNFWNSDRRFALNWARESVMRIEPAVTEEKIKDILDHYFHIGDSYTFELTRVKEAFAIGTMSLDDFDEWSDENTADLAKYIMDRLNAENEEESSE